MNNNRTLLEIAVNKSKKLFDLPLTDTVSAQLMLLLEQDKDLAQFAPLLRSKELNTYLTHHTSTFGEQIIRVLDTSLSPVLFHNNNN